MRGVTQARVRWMMSAANKERVQALEQFSAEGMARLLAQSRERGAVWSLRGIGDEQVYALLPELRAELETRDMLVLGMDPTGTLISTRTFREVIDTFVMEVERRGKVSAEIEDLLEWMHTSQDPIHNLSHEREVILTDTLARLWRALCDVLPAILFVFYPHRCTSQVQHQLGYLARYHFTDPIAELAPEVMTGERSRGALVAIRAGGALPEFLSQEVDVTPLDVTEHMEESVRQYLARPDVIRGLVETTRGDLSRLEDLVNHLDGDVHHLWMSRVERLGEVARSLVELLAVCDEPLEIGLAHRALMQLVNVEHFSNTARRLIDAKLIQRVVQMGSVRLGLAEPDFAESVCGALEQARERALHRALHEAAREDLSQSQDLSVFIAQHAFAAGDIEIALEAGVPAARKLFGSGALEEAAQLIDCVLEHTEQDVICAELHAMAVDVWARLGRWRSALRHCGHLKRYVVGLKGSVELSLRTASLLGLMNRYETAQNVLDGALEKLGDLSEQPALAARVISERGEMSFKLGCYTEAMEEAQRALDLLATAREREMIQAHIHDRAVLSARNLAGKVDIMLGRHEAAIARFEENLELARSRGWGGEEARAQGNLGVVAMQRFDYDEAITLLEGTLEFSKHSQLVPRSICLLNLALIYHYRFEYMRALSSNLESMRVARQDGVDSVYSNAAQNLAMLYRDMGALDRAEQMLQHLEDRGAPQRNTFVAMRMRVAQANIHFQRGDFARVVELLANLEEEAREDVIGAGRTESLRLALAYVELGKWEEAEALFASYDEDPEREELNLEALYIQLSAHLKLHDGDAVGACEDFATARDLSSQVGNFREATRARFWRAQALVASGQAKKAAEELTRAMRDVVEHADRIPASLRQGFFAIPIHARITAFATEIGVEIPSALRTKARGGANRGDGARDASWYAWRERYGAIVGENPRLLQVFKVIDRVADSDTTMLLLGESGTGKELIAEAIHAQSNRAKKPLIKVNCAAFVESLLMSELFGHEKGSFTGAAAQKIGRFEMAEGGTIFLDEIADITPQTQVALLRVLQERQFERVGGTETIDLDVRVICATNKNLEEMVEEGTFRLDLYYRLKGMVIELPALRDRRGDIPLLVERFAEKFGKQRYAFERAAMRELVRYSWPGNIRELQNFIKSMLLFVEGSTVTLEHVQEFEDFFSGGRYQGDVEQLLDAWQERDSAMLARVSSDDDGEVSDETSADVTIIQGDPEDALVEQIVAQGLSLTRLKKRLEIECIKRALIETDGNVTQAASILQMKRPRLSQIINADEELVELKNRLTGS